MQIDIESLKNDLLTYLGTAVFGGMPAVIVDLSKVEHGSMEEIIEIALRYGFDLNKYQILGNNLQK